ncbi:hypothetical protein BDA99DRAFT_537338 [Phascolomyces articulosus]|uniref:Uncharacterized protein n=1 Tax=Phascolomyces articulosus TaxID=60185 RepID=A0AAD5K0K1_9FUNG|nr:hypothetical protein BDA99DRAFT_537338 [Phascolomyces articulosus]
MTTMIDRTCKATLFQRNSTRSITGKEQVDIKRNASCPDLLTIKNNLEYACSEAGKSNDVVATKKELIIETGVHVPKLLKDLFNKISKDVDNDIHGVRSLKAVCFRHILVRM